MSANCLKATCWCTYHTVFSCPCQAIDTVGTFFYSKRIEFVCKLMFWLSSMVTGWLLIRMDILFNGWVRCSYARDFILTLAYFFLVQWLSKLMDNTNPRILCCQWKKWNRCDILLIFVRLWDSTLLKQCDLDWDCKAVVCFRDPCRSSPAWTALLLKLQWWGHCIVFINWWINHFSVSLSNPL